MTAKTKPKLIGAPDEIISEAEALKDMVCDRALYFQSEAERKALKKEAAVQMFAVLFDEVLADSASSNEAYWTIREMEAEVLVMLKFLRQMNSEKNKPQAQ